MKKTILLISAIFCITFLGCEKDEKKGNEGAGYEDVIMNEDIILGDIKSIYLINEGSWGLNNASLTYIEKGKAINNYFAQNNNRRLGDLANDIKLYGSKLYIVMNGSNTVEIIDVFTGKSLKQISCGENAMPRQIAFDGNYAYVSCHNRDILKIDTTSMIIAAKINTSGSSPEGIAVQNGKLYVTNSGGQDFEISYDSTLSIIDINTFIEENVITIGLNPGNVIPFGNDKLLISVVGNYFDVPSSLKVFNTSTNTIEKTIEVQVSGFTVYNQTVFGYNYDYSANKVSYVKYDLASGQEDKTSYVKDENKIENPNGIIIEELSGDIYIMDAVDYNGSKGTLYCFDKSGNLKFNVETGVLPKKIVFIK